MENAVIFLSWLSLKLTKNYVRSEDFDQGQVNCGYGYATWERGGGGGGGGVLIVSDENRCMTFSEFDFLKGLIIFSVIQMKSR